MIIWIASYPKSGNTYLRSFISSYYFSKKGKFNFDLLLNILQFPSLKFSKKNLYSDIEASQNWIYNQNQFFGGEKINFLKTHNSLNEFKGNKFTTNDQTIGAIYIVRDPRNLISSISNHYSQTQEESFNFIINKNKMIMDDDIGGKNFGVATVLGSWSYHYKSWANSKIAPINIIKYEDLIKDTINSDYTIMSYK